MQIEYNGFIIRISGLRNFKFSILIGNRIVCSRSICCTDIRVYGRSLNKEIKSQDEAVILAKNMIDRHSNALQERYSTSNKLAVEDRRSIEIKSPLSGKSKVSKPIRDNSIFFYE
jgi:hypothetical protein